MKLSDFSTFLEYMARWGAMGAAICAVGAPLIAVFVEPRAAWPVIVPAGLTGGAIGAAAAFISAAGYTTRMREVLDFARREFDAAVKAAQQARASDSDGKPQPA